MSIEIVGAATALAALIWGVYTSHRGWTNGLALRRAEFIRGYTSDFYEADALPCLFLEIDSGRFAFGPGDIGTQAEIDIARLLDFFNTVGMSVDQGVTALADLRKTTIGYAIMTSWRDSAVQWFLHHVDTSDQAEQLNTLAFGYFRQLGAALESGWEPTRANAFLAAVRGATPPLPQVHRHPAAGELPAQRPVSEP